ncbi:MAG: hypothetical protein AAF542_00110 [Pseudomonadota bacterium]
MPVVKEDGQRIKLKVGLLGAISVLGAMAGAFFGSALTASWPGIIAGGLIGMIAGAVIWLLITIFEIFS